ncbi:hypothetical protein [Methyloversatilis sp. XJ19-49]|uniref:hypothetical protein n=1 Tax=Methyloversatilis sp. XJ19-49 TaxID=2963429 RepID=UPI00211D0CFD|nr:hypothetical protein [Methyloversatilis sp. XJ19-49]MCQ9377617.1 hypothetical protein [Methyloversatilis sp. XJ19-49]
MNRHLFHRNTPVTGLIVAFTAAVAASATLRYGLMESDVLHGLCAAASDDWRCAARRYAPQLFIDQRIGWLALAAGALAMATRIPMLAAVAVVSGGAGLILYSADYAAAGLLLGLIALASTRSRRSHAH